MCSGVYREDQYGKALSKKKANTMIIHFKYVVKASGDVDISIVNDSVIMNCVKFRRMDLISLERT